MTRYALGDGPRRRRAHQWLPDILSEPVERLVAILDAHLAKMTPAEQKARLAAGHVFLKAHPSWRGRTVPGLPCTRMEPGGFGSWEEWRTMPGVVAHT